jgi:hypothetical protein
VILFWISSIIFAFLLIVFIVGLIRDNDDVMAFSFGCGVLVFLVFGIWGIIATAFLYNDSNYVRYSKEIVAEYQSQRDQLIAILQENLSVEDFERVMAASVPEDVSFLATRPDVAAFLLGKAEQFVEVNAKYFDIRNDLLSRARSVCSNLNNPFFMRFPTGIECDLNAALEVLE